MPALPAPRSAPPELPAPAACTRLMCSQQCRLHLLHGILRRGRERGCASCGEVRREISRSRGSQARVRPPRTSCAKPDVEAGCAARVLATSLGRCLLHRRRRIDADRTFWTAQAIDACQDAFQLPSTNATLPKGGVTYGHTYKSIFVCHQSLIHCQQSLRVVQPGSLLRSCLVLAFGVYMRT